MKSKILHTLGAFIPLLILSLVMATSVLAHAAPSMPTFTLYAVTPAGSGNSSLDAAVDSAGNSYAVYVRGGNVYGDYPLTSCKICAIIRV